MDVHRKRHFRRTRFGGGHATFIQVRLTEAERRAVDGAGLWNRRIRSRARLLTPDLKAMPDRIPNRWNVGVARGTGWVLGHAVMAADLAA